MTRIYAILLAVFAFSLTVAAQQRSYQEIRQIAYQKLQKNHKSDSISRRVQTNTGVDVLMQDRMYTIAGGDDMGFVVVSNDQRLRPVLAYSDHQIDINNIPCGMKWWLNAISKSLEKQLSSGQKKYSDSRRTTRSKIEPFLACTWGQKDPFNMMCPEIEGTQAPAGCVATALAQVLYHHKYPESSEGEGYYTISDGPRKYPVSLNSTYDWSLYDDSYVSSFFLTEEKKKAIAQLLYDCGVAVHMNYDASSSGAILSRAGTALCRNFKCDSLSIRSMYRQFYGDEDWMDVIYTELAAGRPILYGGQDEKEGGHAFVLHGIDEEGLVYVNWGWNGNGDCWTSIDLMSPEGETSSFVSDQDMVVGLRKSPVPTPDEKYLSSWGVSSEETLSQNVFKRLQVSDFSAYNLHHLTFYGTVGLYLEKIDGSENLMLSYIETGADVGPVESGSGYNFKSQNFYLSELSVGTYYAYLVSKAVQEDKPQPLKQVGGNINVYTITIHDDRSITIDNKETTKNVPIPTAINELLVGTTAIPVCYFDLQGREVSGDTKGLLIRKQGNSVKKVIVR